MKKIKLRNFEISNNSHFCLIAGPAPTDIALSLTGILFIIYSIKNKRKINFFNKFVLLFIIFYFYILLRSIFSENFLLSLENSLFYFRYLFFILSVDLVVSKNSKIYNYLFISLSISFFILIFDGYYQYFTGFNIFGFEYYGFRLSSLFLDEKILGSYLSRLTPIFIGLTILLYGDTKHKIIISLILVLLIDILVILSGERSSIFYIFLSTFLITILISKWKFYRLIAFIISSPLYGSTNKPVLLWIIASSIPVSFEPIALMPHKFASRITIPKPSTSYKFLF